MKLNLIVHLYGYPHHIPQSLTGRSGVLYGHAGYDPQRKAHVLKIDEKLWNERAGKDICAGLVRRVRASLITAELVPDGEDVTTKLAEELAATTALLESVVEERDKTQKNLSAAVERIMELEGLLSTPSNEAAKSNVAPAATEAGAKPVEETPPISDPVISEPEIKSATVADLPPPVAALDALLAEMPYHDLRKVAKQINERRADAIPLNPPPNIAALRALVSAAPEAVEVMTKAA